MLKIGPKYKLARRLGPIFEKTQSQKFAIREQNRGMGNRRRPKQLSEYGKQLVEKQKLRYNYGLKEKHLSAYVKKALDSKTDTLATLYGLLESRLDSVVYRAGFCDSRRMARQLVSHGHIMLNGRKNNVPSAVVKVGDTISIRPESQNKTVFENLAGKKKDYKAPAWLKINLSKFEAVVAEPPATELYEFDYKKIIEFYTR